MSNRLTLTEKLLSQLLLFSISTLLNKIVIVLQFLIACVSIGAFVRAVNFWDASITKFNIFDFIEKFSTVAISASSFGVIYVLRRLNSKHILRLYADKNFFGDGDGREVLREVEQTKPRGYRFDSLASGDFVALTNRQLNNSLILGAPLPFENLASQWIYHANPHHAPLRNWAVLTAFSKGTIIFNSQKIRLAGDISIDGAIKLQRTDYLSSAMTDNLAFRRVYTDVAGVTAILYDGLSCFVRTRASDHKREIIPYSQSGSANQIAVSTLAFSRDGFLLVTAQTMKNAVNAGQYVPSGSGSLDWRDLGGASRGSFRSVLIKSAKRELVEECGLQENKILRQRSVRCEAIPYAFARPLQRGGKPEFFALARVDANAQELLTRRRSWRESIFTDSIIVYDNVGIVESKISIHEHIIAVCNDYLSKLDNNSIGQNARRWKSSYQLIHAISLLKEACLTEKSAAVIDKFFAKTFEELQ